MHLPPSQTLQIKYLSRLFDNTSECYKFFWFKAIIAKVIDGKETVTYDELVNEMIADAWYMVTEYHLNLGPNDTLEKLVHHIQHISNMKSSEKKECILAFLVDCQDKEVKRYKRTLTYNVPYRLQAPFMDKLKGSEWNVSESTLITKINAEKRLIYYIDNLNGMQTLIRIQPEWCDYIQSNKEIIKGWLQYNMIMYLQRRNPSVPGIADKLSPPQERKLEKVKKYWKLLITISPMKDIYGEKDITEKNISIDHFVPWSYVAHDEFWNLHPTLKEINSSKNNNLPDWNKYFEKFAKTEFISYELMHKHDRLRVEFEKCAREHLNNDEVRRKIYRDGLQFSEFARGLEEVVQPVYTAAKNCGFKEWILPLGFCEKGL
ncbi:MAG: HNH endonuclease [Lachnospiraceae bacterium]|nr:HNH endonuclease [Lachnospiraceae bacterium]